MNSDLIEISCKDLTELAIEAWRLNRRINEVSSCKLSKSVIWSVRKVYSLIENMGFKFIDLTGNYWDSGMELEVLDREFDSNLKEDEIIIKEMVSPIILKNDRILSIGQVIVATGKRIE